MRLKMEFVLKNPQLDIEYRRGILSLLKHCFQLSSPQVYEKFYEIGPEMKPFTFGVFLHEPKFEGESICLQSTDIILNFSTYAAELGIYFYNSLIKEKSKFKPYPLQNGNEMLLKRVSLQREKQIKTNEVVFKTCSPFLVRVHKKEDNTDVFLTKNDEGFVAQMEENIRVMVKVLMGREERVEFTPVLLKDGFPIRHYGRNVQGNTGIFKLTGAPEVLDFIYKSGIGSKRSEGFGLIDAV